MESAEGDSIGPLRSPDDSNAEDFVTRQCGASLRLGASAIAAPPPMNVAAVQRLPLASADPRFTPELTRALSLVAADDRRAAEAALESLVGSTNEVEAWCSRMELGTLLAQVDDPVRAARGIELLTSCLGAPFLDVVRSAAWNLAGTAEDRHDTAAESAYASLARDLGEPAAFIAAGDQALVAGDIAGAQSSWLRIHNSAPRTDPMRRTADERLTDLWLSQGHTGPARWFAAARGSIPSSLWAEGASLYRLNGMFNVEGGCASIATRYFTDCSAHCYLNNESGDCRVCGRGRTSFAQALAGLGDGVYPVMTLLDGATEAIGAIALFQDAFEDLEKTVLSVNGEAIPAQRIGPISTLGDLLASSSPMILGVLEIDGHSRPTGPLLFSDASRCLDDPNFTVDVEVPAGDYTVVVWVSAPVTDHNDSPRPLALGALGGTLGPALRRSIGTLMSGVRRELLREMWERPDIRTAAHLADVRGAVARTNYDLDMSTDNPRALSWVLQAAESSSPGAGEILESVSMSESEMRDLLRARGVTDPKFPWRVHTSQHPEGATSGGPPRFCGQCGTPRGPAARFCGECGAAFPHQEQGRESPSSPQSPAPGDLHFPTGGSASSGADGNTSSVAGSSSHDPTRAQLEAAARLGDAEAMCTLSRLLQDSGDLAAARPWMERAANAGHAGAIADFGAYLISTGDLETGGTYLLRAAQAGEVRAMHNLGVIFLEAGETELGINWLEKSARAGNTYTMPLLAARLHEMGDLSGARRWYEAAAQSGDPEVLCNFGTLLVDLGDRQAAYTQWVQAANAGNSNAMYNLGYMYAESGDRDGAKYWWEAAARAGDLDAQAALGSL